MPVQVLPEQVVHHPVGQACAKAKGRALKCAPMLAIKNAAAFVGTPTRLRAATGATKRAQRRQGDGPLRGQDALRSVLIRTSFGSS